MTAFILPSLTVPPFLAEFQSYLMIRIDLHHIENKGIF